MTNPSKVRLIQGATKDPSVSITFVKAALAGVYKKSFNIDGILEASGIEKDLFNESKARVSPDQFTRLIQALWRETEDEFIGLARIKSPPGSFAMMCLSVIHCENLRQAFKRANRFYNLFGNDIKLKLEEEGKRARLSMSVTGPQDDSTHFLVECALVILHRFACWLISERIILDKALFSYPPPRHSNEYKRIFCSTIDFDQQETGLEFDTRYLDMAPQQTEQTEQTLKDYLKHSPASIVVKPYNDSSYTARVRALLNKDSENKFPPIEIIAEKLHTAPSTLRRKLKTENTSYQAIKDSIRRDIAIYLLTETEKPISQIAEQLGFSETSTFQHTFKKWSGLPPGAYRGKP